MATARLQFPHCYATLDASARRELVEHAATDGFPLTGILYRPARRDPDTVVLAMHPRVDFSRHYLVPGLLAGGYAFMGATTRYLNHDADALHERLLLDVAGSVTFLRERGFPPNRPGRQLRRRVALRLLSRAGRPARRRASRPCALRRCRPAPRNRAAGGRRARAARRASGEGEFLLERLDPSVVDEADPLATDPRLDMYDASNGYRPMREGPSRYGADFLAAFRVGQRARCARLDVAARASIEATRHARATLEDATPAERSTLARRAYQRPYLLIYRTLADPRYLDLRLDPSQRPAGSIFSFGRDPIVGNFGEGLARTMSARGWLSTWSGLSSNASLARTLPQRARADLVIGASADMDIYPSETRAAFAASGAVDKEHVDLAWAGHYLQPVGAEGARLPHPQVRVCEEVLLPWLRARFPA
jgi:hypothetical protein